jgi:uncharacterized membrane protein YfcA
MQFGRIHGIALMIFGLILIALQFEFSLTGKGGINTATTGQTASSTAPTAPRRLGPLAGIIGGASLVGGFAVFITARRGDEPDPKHGVK